MADTFTPHYNLIKTEIGASDDTWGGKDHQNWEAVDAQMFANAAASADAENIALDALAAGIAAGQRLPPFAITMWSMLKGPIPAGWKLCDGTNGTVDLRNYFIVGAGSTYPSDNKGGADTHTHTGGSIGATALTVAQMPVHDHNVTVSEPGHVHSITDPGHTHVMVEAANFNGFTTGGVADPQWRGTDSGETNSAKTGISLANTKAGVTVSESSVGGGLTHTHTAGTIGTADHRPKYYALCFIMKIG